MSLSDEFFSKGNAVCEALVPSIYLQFDGLVQIHQQFHSWHVSGTTEQTCVMLMFYYFIGFFWSQCFMGFFELKIISNVSTKMRSKGAINIGWISLPFQYDSVCTYLPGLLLVFDLSVDVVHPVEQIPNHGVEAEQISSVCQFNSSVVAE